MDSLLFLQPVTPVSRKQLSTASFIPAKIVITEQWPDPETERSLLQWVIFLNSQVPQAAKPRTARRLLQQANTQPPSSHHSYHNYVVASNKQNQKHDIHHRHGSFLVRLCRL